MKNIHIGNIIRQKVEESTLSIAEFAILINRTRPTVYDIFNRKSIDIDLLISISEVLDYNFLQEVYLKNEEAEHSASPLHEEAPHYIIDIEVNENELQKLIADKDQHIFAQIITSRKK